MDVFDLVAKLSLDTSEAEGGLSKFSSGIGGAISGAVGGVAKAAAAATAAATTAVVGFTASAVKAGSSFDSSMSQVAATMGKTTDEIQDLRDFAKEMGATTSFSASEAADALNYMALAGYDADKSMEMLPNVLNLAAAGGMELAEASDMVTDASSALGLETEETTALVDKMAKASSKSNTSVKQLGAAMLAVGGTAKSMAGGTTEISAALGILADNGTKGAEGGTALRNVLLGLQSDKFEKTFGELGVSAYDAEGNMRPLKDTLEDMNKVMEGMTEQEKSKIITDTFNKADLKNVNALLSTTTERWDELSAAIDDSEGSAAKMAETQLDNLEGDVTKLKSAWEGLQITISEKVMPGFRKFVQFGTDGLSRLNEAFKTGGIEGAMEELGEILSEGLEMIVDIIPDLITVAGKLLSAFGKGLIDNLDKILDATGEIVLKLLNGLVEATDSEGQGPIMQIISKIASFFEENGATFLELGFKILQNILTGISQNLGTIVTYLVEFTTAIVNFFAENAEMLVKASIEIITALVNGIIDNLDPIIDAAVELVTALVEAVIENAPMLIEAAVELVVALADGVFNARDKLAKKGPDLVKSLANGIKNSLTTIKNLGPETINKFIDGIQQFLPNLIPPGMSFIINLIQGISQNFGQILQAGGQAVQQFGQGIASAIGQAVQWGADLISNFISGITSKWNALKSTVGQTAASIKKYLGFSEPEEGPLSDFHTYAPDMMDLFMKGIKDNEGKLQATVGQAFDFKDHIVQPTGGASGTTASSRNTGNMTVILQLDKTQLARTVFQLNKAETRRIGLELSNA